MSRSHPHNSSAGRFDYADAFQSRRWFGLTVLFLIVAGNVASYTRLAGDLEFDTYRQPPGISWIQRLFFGTGARSEAFVEAGLDDLESLFTESNPQQTSQTVENDLRFERVPPATAVVGQRYRFDFGVEGAEGTVYYRLRDHPEQMRIDEQTGTIEWTPAAARNAAHTIEVEAVDDANQGLRLIYTVYVSSVPHTLGTDALGRDILHLLILGTRWALFPGLVVAGIALGLGVFFGGVGAYYGGPLGRFTSLVVGTSEAFPALILLFLAALIFDYRLYPVMAVLGFILFPGVAREVGARVSSLAKNQFIEAARELGLSDSRILWVDIVWHNARSLLISKFFVILGVAVAIEVTLSYLKLGIQTPEVSWGNMIFEGRSALNNGRYVLFMFPSIATMLTVFGYYSLSRSFTDTAKAAQGGR